MTHIKRNCLILLLTAAAFSGVAAQDLVDPPWIKEVAAERVFYELPQMAKTPVRKNVVYKRAGDRELLADIYLPRGARPSRGYPVVLFVHGGTLPPNLKTTIKDWGVYVSYGRLAGASGFVGITFNTRFYDWAKTSEPMSDVADMIGYVRQNAAGLGVDKDRIAVWAFSGGGLLLNDILRNPPGSVKSIVASYPVLDPRNFRSRMPASVTDEMLTASSPVDTIRANTKQLPPILIARAGLDRDLNGGVDDFIRTALEKNLTIEIINHPTGQHAFDVRDNNDRTRQILRRAFEFIRLNT